MTGKVLNACRRPKYLVPSAEPLKRRVVEHGVVELPYCIREAEPLHFALGAAWLLPDFEFNTFPGQVLPKTRYQISL